MSEVPLYASTLQLTLNERVELHRVVLIVNLIVSVPEFRFVKQLVLVQTVKLGDFKTPISL